jgi:hypothetical protein
VVILTAEILTWSEINSDHPHFLIRGDGKENLTSLATITASRKNGEIERSQIGDVTPHWVSHSTSGWMMEEVFEQYLGLLRHYYLDGSELYLMLDSNSAHRTEGVEKRSRALKVRLFFIASVMTDILQPLDRKVFRVLKASAKQLFLHRVNRSPEASRTKCDTVQDLVDAWATLTNATIKGVGRLYDG